MASEGGSRRKRRHHAKSVKISKALNQMAARWRRKRHGAIMARRRRESCLLGIKRISTWQHQRAAAWLRVIKRRAAAAWRWRAVGGGGASQQRRKQYNAERSAEREDQHGVMAKSGGGISAQRKREQARNGSGRRACWAGIENNGAVA